jgi:hypothetical protein
MVDQPNYHEIATKRTFKEISAAIEAMSRQCKYAEEQTEILKALGGYALNHGTNIDKIRLFLEIIAKQINQLDYEVKDILEEYAKIIEAMKIQKEQYEGQMPMGMATCRG